MTHKNTARQERRLVAVKNIKTLARLAGALLPFERHAGTNSESTLAQTGGGIGRTKRAPIRKFFGGIWNTTMPKVL